MCHDFVDQVVEQATKEDLEKSLAREQHETFILVDELARHSALYAKLREEVLALAVSAITSIQALKKLPYQQMVINETFRPYPGVTTNEHVAPNNIILPTGGGPSGSAPVLVRKGDLATLRSYASQ